MQLIIIFSNILYHVKSGNIFNTFVFMKCSELLKILAKDGWIVIRQKGSHLIMGHPIKKNRVVVPYHESKEVKKGTLSQILKDAELKISKR